jgi:hypothetical protein
MQRAGVRRPLNPATLPHVRHETRRASLAYGIDHQHVDPDTKLRSLIRMELSWAGRGDLQTGLALLHPARIIEAMEHSEHLPASGIFVRRIGSEKTRAEQNEAVREARALREKPRAELSVDELRVRLATHDVLHDTDWLGTWRRDLSRAAELFPPEDGQ